MADVEFFVSCGPRQGMGHLYRCLVLARALQALGVSSRFCLSDPESLSVVKGFDAHAFNPLESHDALPPALARIAVADGIELSEDLLAELRTRYSHFVVIDDLADRKFQADLLVNPNVYAQELEYNVVAQDFYLGASYALIDPEFAENRGRKRAETRILTTYGGGATGALAVEVAMALSGRFSGPIDAAVGQYSDFDARRLPDNVSVLRNVKMAPLMSLATHYAGSLGTSFLEAQAAGLDCVVSAIVDNQHPVLKPAREMGVSVVQPFDAQKIAATTLQNIASHRHTLNAASPVTIDSKGAERVAAHIQKYLQTKK